MFKKLRTTIPALLLLGSSWAWSQEPTSSPQPEPVFLFEMQASLVENSAPYTFQVFGDKDEQSYTAYGIQVVDPQGKIFMLDQFESVLPAGSEADALVVEDVNFDGYADVRIVQYLTGGSSLPFTYWLYNPATERFERAEGFDVVKSPQVDHDKRLLVSRQKTGANETVTEFYDPQGQTIMLIRKEVRNYSSDGSSKQHVFVSKDGSTLHLIETRQLAPGEE